LIGILQGRLLRCVALAVAMVAMTTVAEARVSRHHQRHHAPQGQTLAEKQARQFECLAQAVYFEARSESENGQIAVARVVLNRVASNRYPDTICGVVYQGKQRRNRCQFSFACDGRPETITEPKAWREAMVQAAWALACDNACQAAADRAKGLMGTPIEEALVATHYHADYVQPQWADKLERMAQIGRHIFYAERRDIPHEHWPLTASAM
jgi:spore germination cell wall hydrolase CwlJ-like protein